MDSINIGTDGLKLTGNGGPLKRVGGLKLDGGAEINAFDAASQRLFVVSGETELQVVDLSDPSQPVALDAIDLSSFGGGANSVAIRGGLVAILYWVATALTGLTADAAMT